MDWLRDTALDGGAISAPDLDLFTVTDDVAEVVEVMVEGRARRTAAKRPE